MPVVVPSDAERPLILVLDVGTSWVRAAVHDAQARPVEGWDGRRAHPTVFSEDGGVEKDPDNTFALLVEVVDEVLGRAGDHSREIAAVTMAALASSLVGVDGDGRAVTPLYLYSDTRPSAEVGVLRQRLDEERLHQRTGCQIHTSYLPARFIWLAVAEPAMSRASRRWIALPDFLYSRLLGRSTCSLSIASWSGLLDDGSLNWDSELLQTLQVDPGRLTPIGEEPIEGLVEPYASRWPVLAKIPWFPAYADGAASNVGSGCTGAGAVALSLSTTGALRAATDSPPAKLPMSLWRYRLDARRSIVGGALNEGGGLIQWANDVLQADDTGDEAVAALAPDSHGLTVLPFLTGERSPGWQAQLRGVVAGLRPDTSAADILRALMEAAAYRFAHVADAMAGVGLAGERYRANGGAADAYPTWLQIIADVLGRPVEVSGEAEPTSRGAAILTLERFGQGPMREALVRDKVFMPDPALRGIYERAIERQQTLYDTMLPWFDPA
jgi:gluconokinase